MEVTSTVAGYEVGYPSDLDYLIGSLRSHLGDITSPFLFSDGFLRRNLIDAFKSLRIRWQSRYIITPSGTIGPLGYISSGVDYNYYSVTRDLNKWTFTSPEPPVIQVEDERPVVLQAAIIIKQGKLENKALGFGSWRDDELSYSNLRAGDALESSLQRDKEELESMLPSRANKLARPRKQSLPGFTETTFNFYEGE